MKKYIAFDLETTSLNPFTGQIIQMAAVAFNLDDVNVAIDKLPFFNTLVKDETYKGEPFALQMNAGILKRLADDEGMSFSAAVKAFKEFLRTTCQPKPLAVGFNVGMFDIPFFSEHVMMDEAGPHMPASQLNQIFVDTKSLFSHRVVELGSLLATPDDEIPLGSGKATEKYLGQEVSHDALQDCRDAAEMFIKWANR